MRNDAPHPSSWRTLVRPGVVLGSALALSMLLGGCRQARSVWSGTKQTVSRTVAKTHRPADPNAPVVYTDPVYGGGCPGESRVGSGGTGAFKTP
ncbi:MAG: hypothetical protein ACC662_12065 [Planctomycetota bacterium]